MKDLFLMFCLDQHLPPVSHPGYAAVIPIFDYPTLIDIYKFTVTMVESQEHQIGKTVLNSLSSIEDQPVEERTCMVSSQARIQSPKIGGAQVISVIIGKNDENN